MKMQRAELVLLYFDSQDIIATSSSLIAYTKWNTPLAGIDGHTLINHIFAAHDRETLINSNPEITLQISGSFSMWDDWYIFGDCTSSGSDYTLEVTGQASEPTGDEYINLNSEDLIIEWLRNNAETSS